MKKVYIGLATFKGREESLNKVLEVLTPQCDGIFLYNNEKQKSKTNRNL